METDRNVRIDPHSLYEIEKRRAGCRFPFFCYCLSFGGEGEGLVPLHWHNDMEIFYTEAAGILYVNDRTCPVEPGDIAFINPGELHRTSRLSAGDMVHIVFDLSLLRTPDPHGGINEVIDDLAARKMRIRTRAERGTPLYEKLLPLIGRLTEYVEAPVPFGRESCRIQSALYALFSVFFEEDCFEEADESALYGVRHVTGIMEYIADNYQSPLTVGDLAAHVNLSETYIYQLFRSYVSATPVSYINSVRIREAYRLLEEGRNVTETAEAVGFTSVSYFIRLFREATGQTPHQWLKNKKPRV